MSILILAEHNNSEVKSSTLSTISAASKIGNEIEVLVLGFNIEKISSEIANYQNVTKVLSLDDQIFEHCKKHNVEVFRGSENDVLDRHYQCAKKFHLTHIIRIPSDKPLIDPQVIDLIIEKFQNNNFDYIANFEVKKQNEDYIVYSTYPSGTEVEMFSFDALETAWKNATNSEEREHVTPYIYLNPQKFRINSIKLKNNISHLRWYLDYESDLRFIREIINKTKNRPILINDIVNVLKQYPELLEINKENERITKN